MIMAVKKLDVTDLSGVKAEKPQLKAIEYTKHQLSTSKRFVERKDLINALLDDDKLYTIEQAEKITEKFLKGKVK